jgi:predicted O-methyltransferase YrrM
MIFSDFIQNWIRNSAIVKELTEENRKLNQLQGFQPGHFYSPVVEPGSIVIREAEIWGKKGPDTLSGIDLRTEEQLNLISQFIQYYPELPYSQEKDPLVRYYFDNDYYTHNEAVVLYSIMRHVKPKKIVEIGSGFTSAIMLDTNQRFFDNKISLCFIDPYPERLLGLMDEKDHISCKVIAQEVQSVPLGIYRELEAGDILFVDSSHVAKTGSDLNHILFEILPVLQPGVLIHFHDIFYPFEYPKEWVMQGRNWNENYFIRAFLMHNHTYRIRLYSDYIFTHHRDAFIPMPLAHGVRGSSLWLEKII